MARNEIDWLPVALCGLILLFAGIQIAQDDECPPFSVGGGAMPQDECTLWSISIDGEDHPSLCYANGNASGPDAMLDPEDCEACGRASADIRSDWADSPWQFNGYEAMARGGPWFTLKGEEF